MPSKSTWHALAILSVAEFLGMTVWFSASAVVPALTGLWSLSDSGRAWLTMSVQLGFVCGALASVLLNAADRLPARALLAGSAALAAAATAAIPAASGKVYRPRATVHRSRRSVTQEIRVRLRRHS